MARCETSGAAATDGTVLPVSLGCALLLNGQGRTKYAFGRFPLASSETFAVLQPRDVLLSRELVEAEDVAGVLTRQPQLARTRRNRQTSARCGSAVDEQEVPHYAKHRGAHYTQHVSSSRRCRDMHLQTALAAKRGLPEGGAKASNQKAGGKVLAVPVRGRGRGGRGGSARGATNGGREQPLHPASLKITIRNDRVRTMHKVHMTVAAMQHMRGRWYMQPWCTEGELVQAPL